MRVPDDQVLALAAPVIVLGDPGLGKSVLMERIGSADGAILVTARRLLRHPEPRRLIDGASCLVIDALDEVSSVRDGDAVDLVLRQLAVAGWPRFVLSCRVADWRSATAISGIEEEYEVRPVELHLEPFDRAEAERFLSHALSPDRAAEVVAHLERLGPGGLLGNPQTLLMVETVAGKGELPATRGELYERAVAELRQEHSSQNEGRPLATLGEGVALDAAGAACAALLLTGKEAISRAPQGQIGEGVLHIGDVATLLGGEHIDTVLGSRLFQGGGGSRFVPLHRTVAEHLGAYWLAQRADTPRKRHRLLSLLQIGGLVPASLRGLHAWLARDPNLALSIIAADPLGVILYGDADRLSLPEGRALLAALGALNDRNPGFRTEWQTHSMKGVVRAELIEELRRVIRGDQAGFELRALVLDALSGSPVATFLVDDLRAILLDPQAAYTLRERAGQALAHVDGVSSNWPTIVHTLTNFADDDSTRLAVDMLSVAGFHRFDNRQIAMTVTTYGASSHRQRVIGSLWPFKHDLPSDRLDGILDLLSELADQARGDDEEGHYSDDLTDVASTLVARRMKLGSVEPLRLWSWLKPFDPDRGLNREPRQEIAAWLQANDEVRRAIQRHVLSEAPGSKSVWHRASSMLQAAPGLKPTPGDVIALLATFGAPARSSPEEIERWKDTLFLARHGPDNGADVRLAAQTFAGKRKALNQFLDKLAEPRVSSWERRQAKRREKAERKKRAEWAGHRKNFSAHIKELRAGQYNCVLQTARAYLGLFDDMDRDVGPLARLDLWLGEDLRNAALEGFDAFLTTSDKPTATEIAESHAESRGWSAEAIIAAAVAERLRTGQGFEDLPDERLLAAQLSLQFNGYEEHAKLDGLKEAVNAELRGRSGAWEAYWRLLVEPQLAAGREHVPGLYELARDEASTDLATALAVEWLDRSPDMSDAAEVELIDRLAASNAFGALKRIGVARTAQNWRSDARRRTWEAVSFLVNFPAASTALAGVGRRDCDLLWSLRDRAGQSRYKRVVGQVLSPAQAAWVVREFRSAWPRCGHPTGGTMGDTNPWDASDFLTSLIAQLGDNSSDEAVTELVALRAAPSDGYTSLLKTVVAEQAQKRVEQAYTPPSFDTMRAVVLDAAPATVADLQALMLEELSEVQRKLVGHPLDWRKGFFDDSGQPRDEEACRDEVLKMVGDYPMGIHCAPEGHLADDKRADVQCTIGELMLPIEVKGQWHPELWTAAETQLDRLYASDWRADRRGIYLLLWFGHEVAKSKLPKAPPRRAKKPETANELASSLRAALPPRLRDRVEVVVLDLTSK